MISNTGDIVSYSYRPDVRSNIFPRMCAEGRTIAIARVIPHCTGTGNGQGAGIVQGPGQVVSAGAAVGSVGRYREYPQAGNDQSLGKQDGQHFLHITHPLVG